MTRSNNPEAAWIQVQCTKEFYRRMTKASHRAEMNRSEFVRTAVEKAIQEQQKSTQEQ